MVRMGYSVKESLVVAVCRRRREHPCYVWRAHSNPAPAPAPGPAPAPAFGHDPDPDPDPGISSFLPWDHG